MVGTLSEVGGRWSDTCCWTDELLESGRSTSGVIASLRLTLFSGAAYTEMNAVTTVHVYASNALTIHRRILSMNCSIELQHQ